VSEEAPFVPPVAPRQGARKSGRGPFHGLEKEAKLGPVLHAEVLAALKQLQAKRPEVKQQLKEAHGFVVVLPLAEPPWCRAGARPW